MAVKSEGLERLRAAIDTVNSNTKYPRLAADHVDRRTIIIVCNVSSTQQC